MLTPTYKHLPTRFAKRVNIPFLSAAICLHVCIKKKRKKSKPLTANFQRGEEKTKQPRIKTASFTLDGVASLAGASSCTPKDGGFHSQSGQYTQVSGSISGWGS